MVGYQSPIYIYNQFTDPTIYYLASTIEVLKPSPSPFNKKTVTLMLLSHIKTNGAVPQGCCIDPVHSKGSRIVVCMHTNHWH